MRSTHRLVVSPLAGQPLVDELSEQSNVVGGDMLELDEREHHPLAGPLLGAHRLYELLIDMRLSVRAFLRRNDVDQG